MKKISIIVLLGILLLSCGKREADIKSSDTGSLRVSCVEIFLHHNYYDTALKTFENLYGYEVDLTYYSNLDSLFANLDSTNTDVILGLNNLVAQQVIEDSLLSTLEISNYREIDDKLVFDETKTIIPLFYSPLAFIYDADRVENVPRTFGAIQDGKFKDKIIVPNPASSVMGKSLLVWSVAAFRQSGYRHFWRSIKENIFQVVEDYNEAYDRLLAEEVPIIIGYETTASIKKYVDQNKNYKAFIPAEGVFNCIYSAAILKNSKNSVQARQLINHLISEEFQMHLYEDISMYPVNKNIKLPDFVHQQRPDRDLTFVLSQKYIGDRYPVWQKRWEQIMLDD